MAAAVRGTPSFAIRVRDTLRARLTAGLGAAMAAAVRLARRARAPTCVLHAAGPGTHDAQSGTLLFGVGECGARRAAQCADAGLRRRGVRARLSLLGARAVARAVVRARARASTPLTIHRPALEKPQRGVLDFIDVRFVDVRRIRASVRGFLAGRCSSVKHLGVWSGTAAPGWRCARRTCQTKIKKVTYLLATPTRVASYKLVTRL